jgi:hypothetical protein
MAKIYTFKPKKVKPYSEKFLDQVDARKIALYLQSQNSKLTDKLADAFANAIISHTYLDLMLHENGYDNYTFEDEFFNEIINYCKETVH